MTLNLILRECDVEDLLGENNPHGPGGCREIAIEGLAEEEIRKLLNKLLQQPDVSLGKKVVVLTPEEWETHKHFRRQWEEYPTWRGARAAYLAGKAKFETEEDGGG